MLGHRDYGMEDYLDILRRRIWLLIIPAMVGPVVGYALSFTMPEVYSSKTMVLVERQKVPESIAPTVITDQLNERLSTMRDRILSRTRLQPLIESIGLYKDRKAPMEDLVNVMQRNIIVATITPPGAQKGGPVSGFTITFNHDIPRQAQQVCQQLTSMFIEENLKLRENQATNTTEFLDSQLREAKGKLDDFDARMADFKKKYLGQLPGQEQANMNLLMSTRTQLESVMQALNRAQQDKTWFESQLETAITAWKASTNSGGNPQTLEQQLAAARNSLGALEARYSSSHPDVIKLKADIQQLEKRIAELNKPAPDSADTAVKTAASLTEPQNIVTLRSQVRQQQIIIAEKTRDHDRLQKLISMYESRVQLSPLVEQQYSELTRDYGIAQNNYNSLLAKRNTATLSQQIEMKQQGETFKVQDPANLPMKPSSPNRLLFAGAGAGGFLGLGFALALLLEFRDKSLRNEMDVEALLQVPALALMPSVGQPLTRARSWLFWRKKPATA
jgi:polysaccharide chain length determinant protein (PEP-CTERM system associated)